MVEGRGGRGCPHRRHPRAHRPEQGQSL